MYEYQFSPTARRKLKKLARRSHELARVIMRKIIWLAENAEQIAHQPIKGSHFYSLSRPQGITWSGAFRRNSPAKASTPQLN